MSEGNEKRSIFFHEWTTLKTLWQQIRPSIKAGDVFGEELNKYFENEPLPPEKGGWEDLNRAEQIVGVLLDWVRLKFEYDNLLQLARSRKLSALATFENYEKRYFQDSISTEPSDTALNHQRAAYFAVLYSLQSGFVEDRFERQLKSAVAWRLSVAGGGLLALILVLQTVQDVHDNAGCTDLFRLMAVIGMGVIGAFFSRLTRFEIDYSTLRFPDITKHYRLWVLVVRLLCGGIGAVIFYFLLRSGMLKSSLLPDWDALDMRHVPADPKLSPIAEWSKIMVWSFLAGFSERLVSSSLDKMAAK